MARFSLVCHRYADCFFSPPSISQFYLVGPSLLLRLPRSSNLSLAWLSSLSCTRGTISGHWGFQPLNFLAPQKRSSIAVAVLDMCSSGYVQCTVQTLLTGWIRLWWAGMSLKWLLEKKGANLMMNSSASSPCSNAGNKGHLLWWRAFSVSNAILTYLKLQNIFFFSFLFQV